METITDVDVAAFTVPTDQPEADGTLSWDSTTVVVVHVKAGGRVGMGWTYSSPAVADIVRGKYADVVQDSDPCDVAGIHEQMRRAVRNLGRGGLVGQALSAVDIALWDLKARLLDQSLVALLGRCRDSVPVYGSGGFTTYDDTTTSSQLEGWVSDDGVSYVKIKIGESWGTNTKRDLHRAMLARKVIGDDVELFVDANGAYSAHQAVRVGHALIDDADISWFEEPVSSDDLVGLREVRHHLDVDVAAGEYGDHETVFQRMLAAQAVDCLQIDVTRCGGYTTWLRSAAIAAAHGIEVSGHCAPNLHAPIAAAVPNLRHVELFHDHRRCDAMLFSGLPHVSDGALKTDENSPGHGMTLKAADAERYRVS